MSAVGCGYPTPFAGEVFTCGTRLAGFGDIAPILCLVCIAGQVRAAGRCESCHTAPATRTRAPYLCDPCHAAYQADVDACSQIAETAGARPRTRSALDASDGCACSAACGHCGRCCNGRCGNA